MLENTLKHSAIDSQPDSVATPTGSWRAWLIWLALAHALLLAVFYCNKPIAPRAPQAEPPAAEGRAAIYFQGFDPAGETITLTLRGKQPAEIELIASTFAPSPELLQLTAAFPDWALPVPLSARAVKLRI